MVHRTEPAWQTPVWQQALSSALTDVDELFEYLQLDKSQLPASIAAAEKFRLRVPRSYADLITKGDPGDPLLLQILPGSEELRKADGFSADPLEELAKHQAAGVIHKYQGRALLIVTGACAINCRYCFRRHYPYAEASAHQGQWQPALEYLHKNKQISEVILSGGDPLALHDGTLSKLVDALQGIPHLKRLRIHSRMPVVLPERVTGELLDLLTRSHLQPVIVLHINHPRELSEAARSSLEVLNAHGVTLLNQSVLLKNINDEPALLARLSETLFSARVIPYYLHMLDRVQGAAHFEVSDARAREIYQQLREMVPGYLLPRLVRDNSETAYKLPIL
ncbi:EF-P beta-lysylation protein EpmB [Solemya velesiana gill symbiont]|uniref:L-lysine 2,3-aminomutase n=1 Tax=Solemya velesiana gill symbiont TaxID=1918948 RepID=A0A1T2KQM4_9GAMM|nr:EF-P beta-lysylation protein EpmB [Solemya velesiana gill symbiont]OOZ35164.1 EF-P beta-lysylation protein EpmB [Solemya velesiana gill symbiont]